MGNRATLKKRYDSRLIHFYPYVELKSENKHKQSKVKLDFLIAVLKKMKALIKTHSSLKGSKLFSFLSICLFPFISNKA